MFSGALHIIGITGAVLLGIGFVLAGITWRSLARHLREYSPEQEASTEHRKRPQLTVIENPHYGILS